MINFIKRYIKMWHCAGILALNCILVSIMARFGKASRGYVTSRLHHGGLKLLKCVDASCVIMVGNAYHALDKKTPKIFMSNHLSLFDLPTITAHIPEHIRVIIKKELTKVPFVGKAALASEQIIVDRKLADDYKKFYQTAREKLQSGISLWIFPEGTRSRSGKLLPFKLGGFRLALETGAEIIPVAITGTNEILPAGKLMPHLNKKVSIRIGNPISTSHYTHQSIKKLMEQVTIEINTLLNQTTPVPIT